MLSSAVGYHVVINTKGNLVEVSFMDSYCEYKETNKLLQRQNKQVVTVTDNYDIMIQRNKSKLVFLV